MIQRFLCDPNHKHENIFLFFSVNTDVITIILQITHLSSLFAVNWNLLNGFKREENAIKMTAHCWIQNHFYYLMLIIQNAWKGPNDGEKRNMWRRLLFSGLSEWNNTWEAGLIWFFPSFFYLRLKQFRHFQCSVLFSHLQLDQLHHQNNVNRDNMAWQRRRICSCACLFAVCVYRVTLLIGNESVITAVLRGIHMQQLVLCSHLF